ncbi:HAMP domain-containing sensor histidine kinase [Nocardioides sp. BP30]|uniref:sensor histidine kinase n=1 Tax=Nocardioides sp. BP30 TaxID=3036374 RepID=UPI002468C7C7|nr:HAMP domain-containing sensor histidine kinase [Nocardioides sp. BP30]WGL52228.1 HAMP domain-containing sensor histidine kinase [Nocardioides sp. BP30]
MVRFPSAPTQPVTMFSTISTLGVVDPDGDLDDLLWSSFELIADATCALAGFTVVSLTVRVGEAVRCVAVSGNDDARAALLGTDAPLSIVEEVIACGTRHGQYVFLPAGGAFPDSFAEHVWVPPIEADGDPERWQPEDALLAPLLDDDGQIIGALSLDMPADGRRPGDADWEPLQVYAEHARNGLLAALERLRVAEKLHQLESARDLIRDAIRDSSEHAGPLEPGEQLAHALRPVGETLLTHFGLAAAWFHIVAGPGPDPTTLAIQGGPDLPVEEALLPYAEGVSRRLWDGQELAVLTRSRRLDVDASDAAAVELVEDYLARHDVGSILLAPIGVGTACLGLVVMLRPSGAPAWLPVEREAIIEICRDLGGLIAGVISRQRDEQVLSDLRSLETYKSEMVSTVSHELKNPLAAIRTNLELLAETSAPDEAAQLLGAVRRSVARMSAIVEELQGLGTADRIALQEQAPAELDAVLREVCAAHEDVARRRDLRLSLRLPTERVLVAVAASELDRLAGNLVSNAVKYSPAGGEVRITLSSSEEEAVLTVSDDGIGISTEDQAMLFTEFFRTSNAEALLEPGTGLGLVIVRRIVERHGGRIEVDSRLGEGSTFRVHLPCPGASR